MECTRNYKPTRLQLNRTTVEFLKATMLHSKQFVSRLAGLVDICLADQLFGIPSSV